jgi:hypothetical protein
MLDALDAAAGRRGAFRVLGVSRPAEEGEGADEDAAFFAAVRSAAGDGEGDEGWTSSRAEVRAAALAERDPWDCPAACFVRTGA